MTETEKILLCLAVCAAGYTLMQRAAMKRSAKSGNRVYTAPTLAGDLAAALAAASLAAMALLVTGRPVMSALLVLALGALLLVINRAKETILREPLVLADALLIPQIGKYPEMYLPFLPVKAILAATGGVALCLAALMLAENSFSYKSNCGICFSLFLVAFAPVIGIWLLRRFLLPDHIAKILLDVLPVSHDATADAAKNGPLAAALMHPVLAGRMERNGPDFLRDANSRPSASRWPEAFEDMLREVDAKPLDECPHVLLIQAESFCDIREHLDGEQKEALKDFLPNWDKLKALGRTLPTPEGAFGAYTMRTEFSKLTGLEMKELGAFAFNPYLLAARRPMWSLARLFRNKGYETVCMHPYHKGFFRRDKVMPNLGFERFLGIEELGDLEKFGPYTSDLALGERIVRELETATRPVFCFAITMEAHGPWLEGRLEENVVASSISPAAKGLFAMEMQTYLCHLMRIDKLIPTLTKAKTSSTIIWMYGDHNPSILS